MVCACSSAAASSCRPLALCPPFCRYARKVADSGYRPSRPNSMADLYWTLITHCWQQDAVLRPDMSEVVEQLEGLLEAAKEAKASKASKGAGVGVTGVDGGNGGLGASTAPAAAGGQGGCCTIM